MNHKKAAYVATVYSHLAVFHIPYMNMLQEQGYEVHAFASADHSREEVESAGLECRDIPFSRNPLAWRNIRAMLALFRSFRREKYDLIHVHTPNAGLFCRLAARLAGCKNVVYTAHGFHFYKGAPLLNWLVYFSIEWLMSWLTDTLIVINQEDYERAKKFPVRGKVVYLPGIGVDVQTYRHVDRGRSNELRVELGIAEDDFVVLCIAELNRNKNQIQLLQSIREMVRHGMHPVCLLAGRGEAEVHLKAAVAEWGLENAVRFLGFRKDIPELVQMADTVVLLSRREGLPKALLEAMAAGKPMVATDVRGSRELVVPGINGYLVPIGDVTPTVEALTELQSNAWRREVYSRGSVDRVDPYDIGEIANKLKEVYRLKEQIPIHVDMPQITGERKLG